VPRGDSQPCLSCRGSTRARDLLGTARLGVNTGLPTGFSPNGTRKTLRAWRRTDETVHSCWWGDGWAFGRPGRPRRKGSRWRRLQGGLRVFPAVVRTASHRDEHHHQGQQHTPDLSPVSVRHIPSTVRVCRMPTAAPHADHVPSGYHGWSPYLGWGGASQTGKHPWRCISCAPLRAPRRLVTRRGCGHLWRCTRAYCLEVIL